MCVAFDEMGSILWTGDDRGNIFATLFDMTTGKLHSCKRYILEIIINFILFSVYFRVFSSSNSSVTSLSFRFRSTRDGREGFLLANVIPNLLVVFK